MHHHTFGRWHPSWGCCSLIAKTEHTMYLVPSSRAANLKPEGAVRHHVENPTDIIPNETRVHQQLHMIK